LSNLLWAVPVKVSGFGSCNSTYDFLHVFGAPYFLPCFLSSTCYYWKMKTSHFLMAPAWYWFSFISTYHLIRQATFFSFFSPVIFFENCLYVVNGMGCLRVKRVSVSVLLFNFMNANGYFDSWIN
jgi:hypothetical protein